VVAPVLCAVLAGIPLRRAGHGIGRGIRVGRINRGKHRADRHGRYRSERQDFAGQFELFVHAPCPRANRSPPPSVEPQAQSGPKSVNVWPADPWSKRSLGCDR
jgi:hypothetical protein